MPDDSMASKVRDTLFALLATYLALNSQDVAADFGSVPVNDAGQRTFSFEGQDLIVASRATSDTFLSPGVNIYFGSDTAATAWRVKPQPYILPVFVHVLVPWTEQRKIGHKQAIRVSEKVMDAFEGLSGTYQVFDLTAAPPAPTPSRFVSWARSSRGVWVDAAANASSQPASQVDVFTNRRWNWQAIYTR